MPPAKYPGQYCFTDMASGPITVTGSSNQHYLIFITVMASSHPTRLPADGIVIAIVEQRSLMALLTHRFF
ncbi:hypothetical protein [Erwinia psidii]|uniref:Uncharacterized protein n=1 Tax=Erwinia psidii TaxID=69224 RepID=A0A3N6RW99_9GAMM|nr:hypothetical protein [Erwinia psidii]MCX8958765.1 hypothetical protein [Erwinia psidii]MCX8963045.1 hypothetical protein [Erwinia psidii]MCX8965914.1 hypothetical protein [Erwinia psidii]RQM36617.1 hypothetical protein EB241_19540 [Erwinia psidii]